MHEQRPDTHWDSDVAPAGLPTLSFGDIVATCAHFAGGCLIANRCVDGDSFFEGLLGEVATFSNFDVAYTAGRRKATAAGYEAKRAREFLTVSKL